MKPIEFKHTQSAQCRFIKIDTTERLNSDVGGKTAGLQTLSYHYCSLTHNTWYNTTSRVGH